MCGRYALGIRAAFVRHQLQDHGMPVDEAVEDDEVRQTYNFAPGYHGLIYRADVPDYGAGPRREDQANPEETEGDTVSTTPEGREKTRYKLQAMKWGLVPFWTKRNPDYGNVLKTINARDDSLAENRGMWTTMKQKKRCVVIAQGFYEWLKKNGGKEKVPHYVKRKDGQLMCFAGLWDCVQYEGTDVKHYTYTIITTDSNKQLNFLHDRMPVILENGSEQVRTWLDPQRYEWSKDLQSLLKPFDGELECYAVSKDVGKVGNNSPTFIVPVASSENKNNIANFFSSTKSPASCKVKEDKKSTDIQSRAGDLKQSFEPKEDRMTVNEPSSEDNAPVPVPPSDAKAVDIKRERDEEEHDDAGEGRAKKVAKTEFAMPRQLPSPSKEKEKIQSTRKTRSATSNGTKMKSKSSPTKGRKETQRITDFFNK